MRFTSLFSSSAGNAYLVEEGEGRLLLECGVAWKKLEAAAGFSLSRAAGCLISHEHQDHARSWKNAARAGIPVYATEGTARALGSGPGEINLLDGWTDAGVYCYDKVRIGCFDVRPFRTFHDAAEPVGFLIRSAQDGSCLVFATDTVNLAYRWAEPPEILAIECNYDPALLAAEESIPERVRDRITKTHMSIDRLERFLRGLDRRKLREVYLLHLSGGCASARRFAARAGDICGGGVSVTVCPPETGGRYFCSGRRWGDG